MSAARGEAEVRTSSRGRGRSTLMGAARRSMALNVFTGGQVKPLMRTVSFVWEQLETSGLRAQHFNVDVLNGWMSTSVCSEGFKGHSLRNL